MDNPFIETTVQKKNRLIAIELFESGGVGPRTVEGTFTNGSLVITLVLTDMTGVAIGGQVLGVPGVPFPTFVHAVDVTAATITMSQAFAGSTGDYVFTVASPYLTSPTLRLVSDEALTIDAHTSRAELLAGETTQVGYPTGGWQFDWITGAMQGDTVYSLSPLLQLRVAAPVLAESVYGAWIDDGVNALGRVSFADASPLDFAGRVISFQVYDAYPPGSMGVRIIEP